MPEVQVERVNSPSPAGIWSEIGPEIDIEAVIYSAVGSAAAHIDSAAVKPALSACALSEVEHATQPDRPFTTIAHVQEGLAFRSTTSIGVVVRRGANNPRMTQPPLRLWPIRGSSW